MTVINTVINMSETIVPQLGTVVIPPLPAAPDAPNTPAPAASATGAALNSVLSWVSARATSYDVAFGTVNPPGTVSVGQTAATYTPTVLSNNVTYYWRVTARNAGGTTVGPVWSFTTLVATSYTAISNRNTLALPTLPTLGAANSILVDPTFGMRILRVTDGNLLPHNLNASHGTPSAGYQLAWSKLQTKIYVGSSAGGFVPLNFNATTMQVSRMTGAGDGGLVLATVSTEPQFSYVDDDVIYSTGQNGTHSTPIIQKYNFSTATYTPLLDLWITLHNLGVTIPDASYCPNIFSSEQAPEKIVCMCPNINGDESYFAIVFEVGTPTNCQILNTRDSLTSVNGGAWAAANIPIGVHLHGVDIDRTGRYVTLFTAPADIATGHPRKFIWDTQANTVKAMTVNAQAHTTNGWGDFINGDGTPNTPYDNVNPSYRLLSDIDHPRNIIVNPQTQGETYVDGHFSWHNALAGSLQPVLSEYYRAQDGPNDSPQNTAPFRAWDGEIVAIQTAVGATTTVWRFCHHRSIVRDDVDTANKQPFFYEPRVNVSIDGKWAMFTSNWQRTLGTDPWPYDSITTKRYDVFIVQLL